MTELEKSILATLAYYDVLNRPLTGWEVFRYLVRYQEPVKLKEVLGILENHQKIGQKNGFYFLRGRSSLVNQRIERQKLADQRWKKARWVIRMLQSVPFIRLVMLSGSLAINNPRKESDIDLLIVTQAGRIWTCRAITTLLIHSLGQRRHGQLTKNRFCLNHYITTQSLKIPLFSLYNAQTYAHLIPAWQAEPGLYKNFQKANRWIKNYLAFYPIIQKGYSKRIKSCFFFSLFRKTREFVLDSKIGNGVEFILKKFQAHRIRKDPLTYQAGGRVIFNNQQLEFHPDSPEKETLEKYNQEMEALGLAELAHERDSGLTV